MYYIPNGGAKSFTEGDVGTGATEDISIDPAVKYDSVQASASSGPATVYLRSEHTDGYNFQYLGGPIRVYDRVIQVMNVGGQFPTDDDTVSSYGALADVLPESSELFLMNFSWEQTPPNIATVSYSFAYTGANYELLTDPIAIAACPGTSNPDRMPL